MSIDNSINKGRDISDLVTIFDEPDHFTTNPSIYTTNLSEDDDLRKDKDDDLFFDTNDLSEQNIADIELEKKNESKEFISTYTSFDSKQEIFDVKESNIEHPPDLESSILTELSQIDNIISSNFHSNKSIDSFSPFDLITSILNNINLQLIPIENDIEVAKTSTKSNEALDELSNEIKRSITSINLAYTKSFSILNNPNINRQLNSCFLTPSLTHTSTYQIVTFVTSIILELDNLLQEENCSYFQLSKLFFALKEKMSNLSNYSYIDYINKLFEKFNFIEDKIKKKILNNIYDQEFLFPVSEYFRLESLNSNDIIMPENDQLKEFSQSKTLIHLNQNKNFYLSFSLLVLSFDQNFHKEFLKTFTEFQLIPYGHIFSIDSSNLFLNSDSKSKMKSNSNQKKSTSKKSSLNGKKSKGKKQQSRKNTSDPSQNDSSLLKSSSLTYSGAFYSDSTILTSKISSSSFLEILKISKRLNWFTTIYSRSFSILREVYPLNQWSLFNFLYLEFQKVTKHQLSAFINNNATIVSILKGKKTNFFFKLIKNIKQLENSFIIENKKIFDENIKLYNNNDSIDTSGIPTLQEGSESLSDIFDSYLKPHIQSERERLLNFIDEASKKDEELILRKLINDAQVVESDFYLTPYSSAIKIMKEIKLSVENFTNYSRSVSLISLVKEFHSLIELYLIKTMGSFASLISNLSSYSSLNSIMKNIYLENELENEQETQGKKKKNSKNFKSFLLLIKIFYTLNYIHKGEKHLYKYVINFISKDYKENLNFLLDNSYTQFNSVSSYSFFTSFLVNFNEENNKKNNSIKTDQTIFTSSSSLKDLVANLLIILVKFQIDSFYKSFQTFHSLKWENIKMTNKPQKYMNDLIKNAKILLKKNKRKLPANFFFIFSFYFSSIFLSLFTENFWKLNVISKEGGGQLLVDLNYLKLFLFNFPKEYYDISEDIEENLRDSTNEHFGDFVEENIDEIEDQEDDTNLTVSFINNDSSSETESIFQNELFIKSTKKSTQQVYNLCYYTYKTSLLQQLNKLSILFKCICSEEKNFSFTYYQLLPYGNKREEEKLLELKGMKKRAVTKTIAKNKNKDNNPNLFSNLFSQFSSIISSTLSKK